MRCFTVYTQMQVLLALFLFGCSKSDEYYEMLGEQGRVSTLLKHLDSGDRSARARSLSGIGLAAARAKPGELLPAVEPVINSLEDDDSFVRYCAGFALSHLAASVQDAPALARITEALIKHKPQVDNGDDYQHYVKGLTAIAARADEFPELAAKAQAAIDARHDDSPNKALETERRIGRLLKSKGSWPPPG
jgi:hypothetical protein